MGAGRGGFNARGTNPMALMMAMMRNMTRGRGAARGRGGFRGGRGRGGDTTGAGAESK
jgi:hypothetical protein